MDSTTGRHGNRIVVSWHHRFMRPRLNRPKGLIRRTVLGLTPNQSAILRTPSVRPGLALVDGVLVRRRLLCLFGAHRSEIMFGVLIVVLCRDRIAILSFSMARNEVRLRNGVTIAIHTNSFRTIRGRALLGCIFDEVAFWRDELERDAGR